jgi:pimeloyl-ACP methyl ester carboxylesterase
VLSHAGIVLPADQLRPAGHGDLRSPAAPSLAALGGLAEELAAVLDAVGAERAALLTEVDAGPAAILFASTQPERISALVLSHTTARFVAADDYPIGLPAEAAEAFVAQVDQLWGTEAIVTTMAPSRAGDERFRRWLAKMVRAGASPRAAHTLVRALVEVDARPALPLRRTRTGDPLRGRPQR